MTGIVHSFTNDAAELARRGYFSFIGDSIVQIANADNSFVGPFTSEGWQVFGVMSGLSPRNPAQEISAQRTGVPKGVKSNILTGMDLEFAVAYTHPTRLGWELANGSNYASATQYAADGQAAVSSSTSKTVTVVDDATGLAKGDLIEVDLTSGTSYGQFKEFCFILNVSGTTITHTRLAQQPAAGADFLKVAGYGTGATSADAGFKQIIGATDFQRYSMRILTFVTSPSRQIVVEYYPEINIINPMGLDFGDGTAPLSTSFTVSVIQQTDGTKTDLDGVTLNNAPYLGEKYWLPYES